MGRVSVWEFASLDREKAFFLEMLLYQVNYYGFLS